jgi:lipid II:glycine glycyltransferase (peptidoglycan interpeptide bridge formation enzyme)
MESIFQSKYWEEFKLKTGYQKSYWLDGILILRKDLPLGYSMLYSPLVKESQVAALSDKDFHKTIETICEDNNAIFYRLELDIPKDQFEPPKSFIRAFEEMQPEHTLTLDLTKSADQLLSEMKQKGRYNVRLAAKNELTIIKETDLQHGIDVFFELYSVTAKRHHITYRTKKYFDNFAQTIGQNDLMKIYTAYKVIDGKNTPLASAIIVYSGKTAIYMFGASSDEYKNLMAPYLLHWEIIQEARELGFEEYDFFGVAPDDDPKHAWAGVTRFKKQFGGEVESIMGSYDLVAKPMQYKLFKLAEKIRRHG